MPGTAETKKEGRSRMKCKRCGSDMRRIKIAEHRYQYRCPKCGLQIGRLEKQEERQDQTDREGE